MEGLWTILGPILTIILALLSKNVILSLFFGICYFSLGLYGADFLNHIVRYCFLQAEAGGKTKRRNLRRVIWMQPHDDPEGL